MEPKSPHPLDVLVGARVRTARMARGMSQAALAENLGITFQQIQKYERGANRISASKLIEIARALGLPPAELLRDLGDATGAEAELPPNAPGAQDLLVAYQRLKPPLRRAVLNLARDLANGTNGEG